MPGVYGQVPQVRALAELLSCTIVSVDSSTLFERVPVFTCGERRTVRLRSWSADLAPLLLARQREVASSDEPRPMVVIVNNGGQGAGGHFDGTRLAEI